MAHVDDRIADQWPERTDPLAAARGLVNGMVLSIALWNALAIAMWYLTDSPKLRFPDSADCPAT